MSNSLVWFLGGQGTQYLGMGREIYETYEEARMFQNITDQTFNRDLTSIRFNGPKDQLDLTENSQPIIFTNSFTTMFLGKKYKIKPYSVKPKIIAGHSFGQLAATAAAGCFGNDQKDPEQVFKTGIQLVKERVLATKTACQTNPGGMIAVNTNEENIQDLLPRFNLYLSVINTDTQVVIGGNEQSLSNFIDYQKSQPFPLTTTRLRIEGPFHTPLMQLASENFAPTVRKLVTRSPKIPIMSNISARPLTTTEQVQDELINGLVSPVRWKDIVTYLDSQGINKSIEIGKSKLLSGFTQTQLKGFATIIGIATTAGIAYGVWNRHKQEK